MRNTSEEFVEKIKTQNLYLIFISETRDVYKIMYKYHRAGQATDDNKAHAHCTLDT